jgi:glutaredoxin 3
MAKITLFQFETCPFCAKVRAKLDDMGLEYEKVNVPHERDDPQRMDLLEKSGVATVPVILIDDKYIGESADIIDYLEGTKKEKL